MGATFLVCHGAWYGRLGLEKDAPLDGRRRASAGGRRATPALASARTWPIPSSISKPTFRTS